MVVETDRPLRGWLSEERPWLERIDFAVLKTLMMLAAVDGEVSEAELALFRRLAGNFQDNVGGMTKEALWKAALHSAGYIVLQSRLMTSDELVSEFVREAEGDFVDEVALGSDEARERAFRNLEAMARADGDFSEVENACLSALSRRVREAQEDARRIRFPL